LRRPEQPANASAPEWDTASIRPALRILKLDLSHCRSTMGEQRMFQVDSKHPTPIYHQLDRSIRFAIATGKLAIGDQLPTVRQLAVDLRINANTVAKVYAELERNGVVETRRGVGTFVTARPNEAANRRDRERHLRELADHFIAQSHDRGFSLDDVIEHLEKRRQR